MLEIEEMGNMVQGRVGSGGSPTQPLTQWSLTQWRRLKVSSDSLFQKSKPVFVDEEINTRGQVISSYLTDVAGSTGPS